MVLAAPAIVMERPLGHVASDVVWRPTRAVYAQSNITRFLEENGFKSEEELVEASQADVAGFWEAVEKSFGFEWFHPYTKVLDESAGTPWAKWFSDGWINITHNCVDRWAKSDRAGATAILWEGEDGSTRSLTFAELHAQVSRFAAALLSDGIAPGDAVGLFMPMCPETAIAFFAIAKIGCTIIPLFSGFGPDAVQSRLVDANAKALVTADGFLRKGEPVLMKTVADEALANVPSVERVIVFRRLGRKTEVPMDPDRDVEWSRFVRGMPEDLESMAVPAETPFMVIYTSGTTGRPKGSVHVHGGFLVKVAQEAHHQTDCRPGDVLFWFTDMGWIMGPWELVGGLANGATVFLYEGSPDYPAPDRLWQIVESHRISILGVSPTLIRSLMKHGDEWPRRRDLTSLRILASTGEPWNPEPWLWFFEKVGRARCPVINLSGGTEVGACFLSPTPITPLKPCSLGHAAFGMAVAVLDDAGNPAPPGQVGELACLRPWPGMTRGLWNDSERYIETYWSRWPGKWYHGDFASVDEDGQWYLHGRSDDTIKIAGKRVGPAEIESILVDTGKVSEAAAVGVADATKGEVVHVFCILRPGIEPTSLLERQLADGIGHALGKPFRPAGVHFVPDLPRTRNAKILRRAIRAKASGKDAGDLSSLGNPQALQKIPKVV
ncbi:MAG: AMP-binding protein [Thermoplasmatota archaeon]